MQDAMQVIRFGTDANEKKTPFVRANEDRLNENFRLLFEMVEDLQKQVSDLRAAE